MLAERIFFESRVSKCSYFLTLTYDEENLPTYGESHLPCFDKREVQAYLRALRDRVRRERISIRYFLTCEYGDIGFRSHYHAILYFSEFLSLQQVWILCNEVWERGIVYLSSVGAGCCRYVSKYCLKDDPTRSFELPSSDPRKPFRLFSRRPGIGATPEALRYWIDRFSLTESYYDFGSTLSSGNGEAFIPKIPRVVRNKFDPEKQRRISEVGWSRFYGLQDELVNSFNDPGLNFTNMDTNEYTPIYDKDLEILQKTRKLRKLKKHCL